MIALQNITNAFVKLRHGDRVLLSDPWVSDGIFDGGWSPFPPIQNPDAALEQCDYLYLSHIHEDHFDLRALARLPRRCKVVVLDMFPNDIIRKQLVGLGFEDVTMLPPFRPHALDAGLTIEVIPPMNMFAQELALYKSGQTSVAVDAGAALTWDGMKILLLNDDTPYDQSLLEPHLSRFRDCDLLALNYNGAADDYPVCYRGLTDDEKVALSDRRDAKKFDALCELVDRLKPKAVMPYSSEFSVRGRHARTFAKIKTSMYNDKAKMAAALERATGVPAVFAYEQDLLEIDRLGVRKRAGVPLATTLAERADALYSSRANYEDRFPQVTDLSDLYSAAERSAAHMFQFMDRLKLKSEWLFEVRFADDAEPVVVDLRDRALLQQRPADRKTLTCFTDAQYFGALLGRKAHWNNAMISYNLEWERRPNEYDPFLYDSLNFFHV